VRDTQLFIIEAILAAGDACSFSDRRGRILLALALHNTRLIDGRDKALASLLSMPLMPAFRATFIFPDGLGAPSNKFFPVTHVLRPFELQEPNQCAFVPRKCQLGELRL
jgi:hypothetical protein